MLYGDGEQSDSGPMVKRSRHRPFTAVTRVRFPMESPLQRVFRYSLFSFFVRVSKITCGFSKINCGMESWANGNSPKSVVGRNRWILNKKMVKKSGNRVTFGCLIWYKTYFLYYLNFGPFTACFLYGPLVLSVRKQTSFHGLGTAKMAAFFRCEKRKRFRICSKFP